MTKSSHEIEVRNHYVVLDDDETWTIESGAFVVPSVFITPEVLEDLEHGDSKAFKNDIPRISVEMLIDKLERAGLWNTIVDELIEEGKQT